MSMQRVFSIFVALVSVLGLVGAAQLSMTRASNIGPGAMPMAYSIILLAISVMLFFSDKDQPKIEWRGLFRHPTVDALIFFGLNFVMFFLIYLIGTVPAMLAFSILSLLCLKRLSVPMTLVFSGCWVGSLYVIFVALLKVPFATGILMKWR